MTDTITREPLRVLPDETVGPYIRLPFIQLDAICRLLDRHKVRYSVQDGVISLDGGPEEAVIDLAIGTDPSDIQAILDSDGDA